MRADTVCAASMSGSPKEKVQADTGILPGSNTSISAVTRGSRPAISPRSRPSRSRRPHIWTYTATGLSKDDWIFGVRAVDAAGHRGPAGYPVPIR